MTMVSCDDYLKIRMVLYPQFKGLTYGFLKQKCQAANAGVSGK